MSNTPNSLQTHPKPSAKTIPPKPLIGIIIVLAFSVTYMIFHIFNPAEKEVIETKEQEFNVRNDKSDFAPTTDRLGILTADKEEKQPDNPQNDTADKNISIPEIKISRMPEPSESQKRFMQMREQKYLEALFAPSQTYQNSAPNSFADTVTQSNNRITSQQNTAVEDLLKSANFNQSDYDVSADIDKEKFFERSKPDNEWINKDVRTAGQKYELKTGNIIPATMVTAINSDLPGNIIAQVSQNIYDTATGHYLLIPQGTKLFGVYDSRVIMGQQRVLVAWNRLIFPDGSSMTIPSMQGADLAGNSGFYQNVNNHYFRIFGTSALMALITAGTAYAVDQNSDYQDEASLSAQLNSSLAQQLGQTTTSLLEKNLNIKPTLSIDAGYQFNIVLTKDLVFGGSYREWK